jgi:acetyl/propionyl-CoA carboxylase alpha subunit
MYDIKINDKKKHKVSFEGNKMIIDGREVQPDICEISDSQFHIIKDNRSYRLSVIDISGDKKELTLNINGSNYKLNIKDKFDVLLEKLGLDAALTAGEVDLKAPMPGLVLETIVKAGDEFTTGEPLLILEAMKMENVIKATFDGKVKKLNVNQGDAVEKNQILIEFDV